MRITLMVGEHIAPIQFALRLRIPRDTPDIIGANSLGQKSWQAEARLIWCLKLLIHRSGAGAFACEPKKWRRRFRLRTEWNWTFATGC
jgi:hypothetical protein